MKKKLTVLLVPLMALSLSNCAINTFYNTLVEIEIADYRNAYANTYNFKDYNHLEILGVYKNGEVKSLSYNDVTISLFNADGYRCNPATAFSEGGAYFVTANQGTIASNMIEIAVNDDNVIATSISPTFSEVPNTAMKIYSMSLNISPTNFNDDVVVSFLRNGNPYDGVVIEQIDSDSYKFYDENAGTTTLTVKGETLNYDLDLAFSEPAQKVSAQRTYKDLNSRSAPSTGNAKILVVPVWLQDSSTYLPEFAKNNIRNDIYNAFFGDVSTNRCHSVASYYKAESRDLLNLSGTVSDWYYSSYYTYNSDASKCIGVDTTSLSKTRELANTIVDWYFTNNPDVNRTDFDSDSDGYIDSLAIIYAAPDYYSNGVSNDYRYLTNLWAYCCPGSKSSQVDNPQVGSFLWASYDFMYGLETALSRTSRKYYKGSTTYTNIDTHTYIHESGHLFGLRDYYDYSNQFTPAGGFSMQDYNVGGHDPYSVFALGWASPYIPTESCRIRLRSFQETGDLILLSPSFNGVSSPFDEYLLLELYTPTGLNAFDSSHIYTPYGAIYPNGSKSVGVRVWHVDARLTKSLGFDTYSEIFYVDPRVTGTYDHAFSNSYYVSGSNNEHISPVAKSTKNYDYAVYNLLTLIRNNKSVSHSVNLLFSDNDMFYAGSEFNMEDYGSQFPEKGLKHLESDVLDSGATLGWSFVIESIDSKGAIINLTKI